MAWVAKLLIRIYFQTYSALIHGPWSRLFAFVEGGYHHLNHIVMLVKSVTKEGMVSSVFLYMFVEIAVLNEGLFTHSAFYRQDG